MDLSIKKRKMEKFVPVPDSLLTALLTSKEQARTADSHQ